MHALKEAGQLDITFIEANTVGFDELAPMIEEWTPAKAAEADRRAAEEQEAAEQAAQVEAAEREAAEAAQRRADEEARVQAEAQAKREEAERRALEAEAQAAAPGWGRARGPPWRGGAEG